MTGSIPCIGFYASDRMEVNMRKNVFLVFLLLCFILCACNNDTVIPETTLDIYAYVDVDDGEDIAYTKLEEGVVYEYNASRFHTGAGFIEYWRDIHASLTIVSNGHVILEPVEENGMGFAVGEVVNNFLLSPPESLYSTYSFSGSSTVGFFMKKLDTDTISWSHQYSPPAGTVRELTISAWYEKNRDMSGDPQVKITMRLTRASNSPEDFTLEILSIERTPPAYW